MAYSNIAESLLEMHYFRVLVDHYRQALGPNIQLFKPATASEHWYGFDQAFFTAPTPKPDVIQDLRNFIHAAATPRFTSFRAFLLQFKVVEIARKRSTHSPPGWNTPHYRSELYLRPNGTTGISQHEALRRLSGLAGASVSYVCPMIFEENDTLRGPEFTDLHFVDVSSSPAGWLTTERHFIGFQSTTSTPTWCSEPVPGKALNFEQIIERATPLDTEGLFDLLAGFQEALLGGASEQDFFAVQEPNVLPTCLSIVAEMRG